MAYVDFEYLGFEIEAEVIVQDGEAYCESYIAYDPETEMSFEYIAPIDNGIAIKAVKEYYRGQN